MTLITALLLSAAPPEATIMPAAPTPQAREYREPNCATPLSYDDLIRCNDQKYAQASSELETAWTEANRTAARHRQVYAEEVSPEPMQILLAKANADWLAYRDNHCTFIKAQNSDPEKRSEAWSACVTTLTILRARELQAYVVWHQKLDTTE